MTTLENPAFEMLRRFKECDSETEKLVLSVVRKKHSITQNEMYAVFENGIAGEYGKVYSLDPQTLIGWVEKFSKAKNSNKNYLESPLLSVNAPSWGTIEWDKETNKCYMAFLAGVSHTDFHPAVYDRMLLDGKIPLNSYMKHYNGPKDSGPDNELLWKETMNEVGKAKQIVLRNVFLSYKSQGFQTVYFIK